MQDFISYINKTEEASGYTRLSTIHNSATNTIIDEANTKPHKLINYCENRDFNFDVKMYNALIVYKQSEMQFNKSKKYVF